MPFTTAVIGYAQPWVVRTGQPIEFKLSSAHLESATACITRIRCADASLDGGGAVRVIEMKADMASEVALRRQEVHPGSFVHVPQCLPLDSLRSLSVGCWIWPTLLDGREQTVMARFDGRKQQGWRLEISSAGDARFLIRHGEAAWEVRTGHPLMEREWVFIGAAFDGETGQLSIFQSSLSRQGGRDRSAQVSAAVAAQGVGGYGLPLTFAAHLEDTSGQAGAVAHYDGKIDRPVVLRSVASCAQLMSAVESVARGNAAVDVVGAWDFASGIGSDTAHDLGPHQLHGVVIQGPTRAMTGANWSGTPHWTQEPSEFGAIHFHHDDLCDCGWRTDLHLRIPPEWRSGYYSLRLSGRDLDGVAMESHVPFFVNATPGEPRARLAVVASTATYLAYSNSAIRLDFAPTEAMAEALLVLTQDDAYLQEHRELGLSTYDTHADGSGWSQVSSRRPMLNMRPWSASYYTMDTRLLDWLEEKGFSYDIVTDDALDREGASILGAYDCVVTGSHPEYFTRTMLDALEQFQAARGRHLYLGGNGFYWRAAFHPGGTERLEIRRGGTGTRTWEGEAGEGGLAFTGEPGGLWRSNGRPPQRLVGVGFAAQAFGAGASYRRLPAAEDPRVAFVFESVPANEPIGDFGPHGGAAGHEVDRVDAGLGSPPALLHLATADRLGIGGLPSPEEFGHTHRGLDGEQNADVRADMTFTPMTSGGAVFTTGSIAWVMALAHNGYDNNVSRITENVLRRFLDVRPFEGF